MTTRDPQPGQVIDGRYVLDREIGRGGQGVVYATTDRQTGGTVALKVLRQTIADDPQLAARLLREAESLRSLRDESVVRVHGAGHDERGSVYLVMDLLDGETLDHHLTDLEGFGDRMSAFEVLRCLDPVARALHTAHTLGILHGDLTPANIFRVSPDAGGGVRLLGFGLASVPGAEQLAQAGSVTGSPSYLAPEVWRGEPRDHRVDVYSLAAVTFRCLAGRAPFVAETPRELFTKVIQDARPRLTDHRPDLPPGVDAWIAQSLAIERDRRYPYVSTMWNDLLRVVMSGTTPSAEKARATFRLPS